MNQITDINKFFRIYSSIVSLLLFDIPLPLFLNFCEIPSNTVDTLLNFLQISLKLFLSAHQNELI